MKIGYAKFGGGWRGGGGGEKRGFWGKGGGGMEKISRLSGFSIQTVVNFDFFKLL